MRKNATKSSTRVKSGVEVGNIKVNKKTQNKVGRLAKNTSAKAFLIALVFLVVGALVGAGAWWIVCRKDCFQLLGQEEIVLTLDEKYVDEGVKVIAFGQDKTKNVVIETNLKRDIEGKFFSDEVGTFYIKYKSESFKYGKLFKVEKVRLITFVEASEGGE